MVPPNMPSPKGPGHPNRRGELPEKRESGPQPSFQQPTKMPHGHPQYHATSPLNTSPAFPAAGILQRRRESNPEQKQKLLSLFGKPQPSPTAPIGEDNRRESSASGQAALGGQRSRVASLASANGDVAQKSATQSRRGSQTPISPADRDFLLGFLQSVGNKAH